MNLVKLESKSMHPDNFSDGDALSIYTYLTNVEYQVKAHFEWNYNRSNLEKYRNKHYLITKKMIKCGSRWDIFIGARECKANVELCKFGEGQGAYDNCGSFSFGVMLHSFGYPDETGKNNLTDKLWTPIMNKGYIKFLNTFDCAIKCELSSIEPKTSDKSNFNDLDEYKKLVL